MDYRTDRYQEVASPEITGTVPTSITIRLGDIAYARSADRGAVANIGVIAYSEEGFKTLLESLSAERVAAYFAPLRPGKVRRYALPNLFALNFVLPEILDGGSSRSLRIDAPGKSLGQALHEKEIDN